MRLGHVAIAIRSCESFCNLIGAARYISYGGSQQFDISRLFSPARQRAWVRG